MISYIQLNNSIHNGIVREVCKFIAYLLANEMWYLFDLTRVDQEDVNPIFFYNKHYINHRLIYGVDK